MKDSAFTSRAISEASRDVPYYFDNEHMDFKLPNVGDDPLESRGLGAHALYNFRSLDSLTKDASMLILELSSSNDEKGVPGEYKDMTVRELLAAVNKEALEIDSKILGSYANMVSVRRFNRKVEVRRGNMNSDKEHVGPQKRSPSYGKVKSEAEAANILLSGITGYLQNKDVRRIEFKYTPNDEPRVTLRRHCVVFSFDPIRAIITPSKMYICVPDGADTMLSLLQRHIQVGNFFCLIVVLF
jgi:hypothetical protein